MLDHSCQVQRRPLAERGHDLYETPSPAVEALLRFEHIPRHVWEPACGPGAIVRVLRGAGHIVTATDLIDYGCPDSTAGIDFLLTQEAPDGCEAIITNPPFKLAEEFVAHALELAPCVVMLLRLAFLESDRRRGILEGCGLARVRVFRKRLPMMHRAGWEKRKANSGMAFAWFVWERTYRGLTQIDRISWEDASTASTLLKPRGDETMTDKLPHEPAVTDAAAETIKPEDGSTPLKLVPDLEEELDEDEKEFRAMRRDLAGVQGEAAVGIVAISVGKAPPKNEFFRTHPDFRPIVPMVNIEIGMEKKFFAVTPAMVEQLGSIGITVCDHALYLTVTPQRVVRIVPVRQANADGDQNEYDRTKEIGMIRACNEWVRLFTDQENRCYKVFPAPLGRFADPVWPELKHAKIFRLAFRDRGHLIDSVDHPLFQKWAARDRD